MKEYGKIGIITKYNLKLHLFNLYIITQQIKNWNLFWEFDLTHTSFPLNITYIGVTFFLTSSNTTIMDKICYE